MYHNLANIAQSEFSDIVTRYRLFYRRSTIPLKLRLYIRDGTLVDVWVNSGKNRYAYHWEQRAVRGAIHRHDNAPDHPEINTFPKHFHDGHKHMLRPSTICSERV